MKPETLDALLIDRELGELSPDVVELLDSYLEVTPSARQQVADVTRTVGTARETVRRFPELARATEDQSPASLTPLAPWLTRAAVIAAAAMIVGWLGYRAGINSIPTQPAGVVERSHPQTVAPQQAGNDREDLWARYSVAFDRHRGTFTIALQP